MERSYRSSANVLAGDGAWSLGAAAPLAQTRLSQLALALVLIALIIEVVNAIVFDLRSDAVLHRDMRGAADILRLGLRRAALRFRHGRIAYCGGKYFSGSTGLPCRRTSKCNITRSESLLPISAIFCPLVTASPSFTIKARLCAYAVR